MDCYGISLNGFLFYFILLGKTLRFSIATTFFLMGFFPSKIIFVGFFFNIKLVENLAL
jgi:hypothetical protein